MLRYLILFVVAAALLAAGCDSETSKKPNKKSEKPAKKVVDKPTTYESDKAPYSVELPDGWTIQSKESLNKHADLAATFKERLFLIIIPQKLPTIDGVEPPDAEALKSASLERMRKNVSNLTIEQEGPVSLKDGSGLSVFAEGSVDDNRVQYIATFVTYEGWGYQVIAWGPARSESQLIDSVDTLIGGWQFRDDSLPSANDNAQPGEASEDSTDQTH